MDKIKSPTPIAILMATYNGEPYLKEQLDSLLKQTHRQWTLYIHDDGSTDGTLNLLRQYASQYDNIRILDYPSQKGAKNNFLSLLQRVEARYYMFCDQDDVWLKDRIAISLEEIELQESRYSTEKPIIVYNDLHVTDANLRILYDSFWQEICVHPEFLTTFDEVAGCIPVTGCAMIFNHRSKESVVFPAPLATMHDAWITCCTLKNGGIIHPIHQQLILYRQHQANSVGAEDLNHIDLAYRITHFGEMQGKNWRQYRMMRSLGYGSIFKFFRYKWLYKKRIQNKIRAK